MARSYGLGAAGLTGLGTDQRNDAMQVLGNAADQETRRQITNDQNEAGRKAGNQQLGATVGGIAGSAFGPWGAVAGSVVGALASDLF